MSRNDSRPRPDREAMRAAIRGEQLQQKEYLQLNVYVDGELVGEPVAERSTLQEEINAIFKAARDDSELHGHVIEIRVYEKHECVDVQTIAAHDWTPLDLRSGKRQTCQTCGEERKPIGEVL